MSTLKLVSIFFLLVCVISGPPNGPPKEQDVPSFLDDDIDIIEDTPEIVTPPQPRRTRSTDTPLATKKVRFNKNGLIATDDQLNNNPPNLLSTTTNTQSQQQQTQQQQQTLIPPPFKSPLIPKKKKKLKKIHHPMIIILTRKFAKIIKNQIKIRKRR